MKLLVKWVDGHESEIMGVHPEHIWHLEQGLIEYRTTDNHAKRIINLDHVKMITEVLE